MAFRKSLPLAQHLMLLVLGVLFPSVIFSTVVVWKLARNEQHLAEQRLVSSSRDLAVMLDREMNANVRALSALAQSDSLRRQDWPRFQEEMRRTIGTQPSWAFTILFDVNKKIVARSSDSGRTAPADPESLDQAITSGDTVIGNLRLGPRGRLAFPIRVPVKENGKLKYVLTAVIDSASLADIVAQHQLPGQEWTRTIVDQRGTIVARSRAPERFVGTPASTTFIQNTHIGDSGMYQDTTLDGQEAYVAYATMNSSKWTAAIVVPKDIVEGPAFRVGMSVSIAGLTMIVLITIAAVLFSRGISRAMVSAAQNADQLARGERPAPYETSVSELEKLRDALTRAADLLAQREQERQQHLQQAHQARAVAELANKEKDEFLAMLGHELRNPLGPIRHGTHLLHRRALDDDTRELTSVIDRQLRHLTRIVDDLLDASRLTRAKLTLQFDVFDLRALVHEVGEDNRIVFEDARIHLLIELPEHTVLIRGDRTRIAQSIGNLLHNAIKFTSLGGHVWLILRTEFSTAKLTVRDDGMGIDPALLPNLFRPFAQGPQSLNRPAGGLGLGLALVRGFTTLHGGNVTAHSDGLGKGTSFTLTLPLTPVDDPTRSAPVIAPASPSLPSASPAKTHRRVLIIEDLQDAARTLALLLQAEGHQTKIANSAGSAMAVAEAFAPDVIICDIGLPDMDGYTLCRRLRVLPALEQCDFIALTGYGQASDILRATDAGFHHHMTKPVDIPRLLALVRTTRTADAQPVAAGAP